MLMYMNICVCVCMCDYWKLSNSNLLPELHKLR